MTTPTEFQRPLSDGLALIPVSEQPAGMTDELMFFRTQQGIIFPLFGSGLATMVLSQIGCWEAVLMLFLVRLS
jgi:hypothetical protein